MDSIIIVPDSSEQDREARKSEIFKLMNEHRHSKCYECATKGFKGNCRGLAFWRQLFREQI